MFGATHGQMSPDALPGLALWLKADAGITLEGNNVLNWDDQSGNNNDAAVFAGSLRPAFVNNVINGFPVVRFDGSNDFLDFPELNNIRNVFWVIKEDLTANSVHPRALLGHTTQTDFIRGPNKLMWNPTLTAPEVLNGTTRVNFQEVDGITTLIPTEFSVISVSTTGNTSASSIVVDRLQFQRVWDGDLAELIIFSEALTPEQVIEVETYLADKYTPEFYVSADVEVDDNFCPVEICAAPGFTNYLWSNESTASCTQINNTGAYSITAHDVFGRVYQDTIYAQFPGNTAPDSTLICLGDTYTWDTGLDENIYAIQWPDLTTSSSYTSGQEGYLNLVITDGFQCSINTAFYIEVDEFPEEVSLGPDLDLCSGNMLSITPYSSMPASWLWSTDSEESSIQIEESGSYSLIATNQNLCLAFDTIDINIFGIAPIVSFSTDAFCEDSPTNFSSQNISGLNVESWNWTFGDDAVGSGSTVSHTYSEPGIYNVSLEGITIEGCSGFYNSQIEIHQLPIASFEVPSPCNNQLFLLESEAESTDGVITSYTWEIDDISTNGVFAEYGPLNSGFHEINHTVETEFGCITTVQLPMLVKTSPVVDFSHSGQCLGYLTFYDALVDASQSGPIQNYTWTFGDGTFSDDADPENYFVYEGEYEVELIVDAQNGCSDTMLHVVNIVAPPIIDFNTQNACIGQAHAFAAEIESGYAINSIEWNLEGDEISNEEFWYHTFEEQGFYSMTLDVVTIEGCVSSITQSIPVWPLPEANFIFSPQVGPPPLTVEYSASGSTGVYYEWFFGDGQSDSGFDMTHTYESEGSYVISFVASNAYGCTDTAYSSILIAEPVEDIVIEKIALDESGRVLVWLVNNGNLKVRHLRLTWQQGGDSPVTEWWNGIFNSGEVLVYQFESGMNSNMGNDPYICVKVEAVQTGFEDVNPSDNEMCKPTSNGIFELYAPYYQNTSQVALRYVIPENGDVHIELMNTAGNRVQSASVLGEQAGLHTFTFDLAALSTGAYVASIRWREETKAIRFFVR